MSKSQDAVSAIAGGVQLQVKAVPGASRSRVVGWLGDHLKVAVAAPPEAGKANKAICELLAQILGLRVQDVQLTAGASSPRKRILLAGTTVDHVKAKLGLPAGK